MACDTRGLLAFLHQRGLPLPHVSLDVAEKMAYKALALTGLTGISTHRLAGGANRKDVPLPPLKLNPPEVF